jgi:hypothetical protein
VAALCSVGVLGLVCRVGFGKGWWSASFGAFGGGLWVAALGLRWLCTFRRNPCSGLAGASDGDGRGHHILSWKHRREVCALLHLRPRLLRKTLDPGSGDGGAALSLPCWGIASESPAVRDWEKMLVVGWCVRSKCAVLQR